ncbi:MAG TPA: hypothetical protein VFL83_10735 [Anaeromyxobacter sp.]|nr:hypothetical protein [Anaeromyxobacter sp.]
MRRRRAAALAVVIALVELACAPRRPRGGADAERRTDEPISADERARNDCRIAFALCAPPASYASDTNVETLDVRNLVQIAWRLDLPDALCAKAGRRLRKLAERAELDTVREIAAAGDAAAGTLGRCRCEGTEFRPEYEKQQIARIVSGRLPPAELTSPAYWAARIEPRLARLRDLSRRSAEVLAVGGAQVGAELDAAVRDEERSLCEDLHAARDVLTDDAMTELRDLVARSRARDSGEASADLAVAALDRAARRPSCADAEQAP